jgi:hypothetical protein
MAESAWNMEDHHRRTFRARRLGKIVELPQRCGSLKRYGLALVLAGLALFVRSVRRSGRHLRLQLPIAIVQAPGTADADKRSPR